MTDAEIMERPEIQVGMAVHELHSIIDRLASLQARHPQLVGLDHHSIGQAFDQLGGILERMSYR